MSPLARDTDAVQDRTERWARPERHIRMPDLNFRRVLAVVLQNSDFWMAVNVGVRFMQLRLTEVLR